MKEFAEEVQRLLEKNDYVQVVRCRHCKHRGWMIGRTCSLWCTVNDRAVNYKDYCSWGERDEE